MALMAERFKAVALGAIWETSVGSNPTQCNFFFFFFCCFCCCFAILFRLQPMDSLLDHKQDKSHTNASKLNTPLDDLQNSPVERQLELLNELSVESKQYILKLLGKEEVVEFVDKPSYWRANGAIIGVSFAGTIGVIVFGFLAWPQAGMFLFSGQQCLVPLVCLHEEDPFFLLL